MSATPTADPLKSGFSTSELAVVILTLLVNLVVIVANKLPVPVEAAFGGSTGIAAAAYALGRSLLKSRAALALYHRGDTVVTAAQADIAKLTAFDPALADALRTFLTHPPADVTALIPGLSRIESLLAEVRDKPVTLSLTPAAPVVQASPLLAAQIAAQNPPA